MTPLVCGESLAPAIFSRLRRQMVLDHFKWDPQVEDVPSLCSFPLMLDSASWQNLTRWAEGLADETLRAEAEILQRPDLMGELGLPRSIRRLLQRCRERPTTSAARIMRFDFHWTIEGWRVSEVNSDVPGGFIESSAFTRLMQQSIPGTITTGDPAETYMRAIANPDVRSVAMVHATAYSDDRQVMTYLSRELAERGVRCWLVSPGDLTWESGIAHLSTESGTTKLDAIVRFYPGEWLPNLKRRTGWQHFFVGGRTPVSNPATALVTQSKRFPLVWDRLKQELPLWRTLLPETRDPRQVPWQQDESWVMKPAMGRVGESIGLSGVTTQKEWRQIRTQARWWPSYWAAQKRFHLVPLKGPDGDVYPVIGVYTVDREVAGVYARVARRPLIDHLAQDIAVLISPANQQSSSEVPDDRGFIANVERRISL